MKKTKYAPHLCFENGTGSIPWMLSRHWITFMVLHHFIGFLCRRGETNWSGGILRNSNEYSLETRLLIHSSAGEVKQISPKRKVQWVTLWMICCFDLLCPALLILVCQILGWWTLVWRIISGLSQTSPGTSSAVLQKSREHMLGMKGRISKVPLILSKSFWKSLLLIPSLDKDFV